MMSDSRRRRSPESSRRSRRKSRRDSQAALDDDSARSIVGEHQQRSMPGSFYPEQTVPSYPAQQQIPPITMRSNDHTPATAPVPIPSDLNRPRRRSSSFSSSSAGSSSSSSYLDISRWYPSYSRYGGVLKTFFRTPSEHRPRRRRSWRNSKSSGSRKKKSGKGSGVFGFGNNSSSSSVNSDMAYGMGFIPKSKSRGGYSPNLGAASATMSSRRERTDQRGRTAPPLQRRQTDEEIVEIGRKLAEVAKQHNREEMQRSSRRGNSSLAAAAAAAGGVALWDRFSRHGSGTEGGTSGRGLGPPRPSRQHGHGSSSSDESDWESASEDEDSDDASALAYGHADFRSSTTHITKMSDVQNRTSTTTNVQTEAQKRSSIVDPKLFGPCNSLRDFVNTPCGFDDQQSRPQPQQPRYADSAESASLEARPLQRVFPLQTSDPSQMEAARGSGSIVSTRPEPVPIQAPVPIAPVPSRIYNDDGSRVESPPRDKHRRTDSKTFVETALVGAGVATLGAAMLARRDKGKGKATDTMEGRDEKYGHSDHREDDTKVLDARKAKELALEKEIARLERALAGTNSRREQRRRDSKRHSDDRSDHRRAEVYIERDREPDQTRWSRRSEQQAGEPSSSRVSAKSGVADDATAATTQQSSQTDPRASSDRGIDVFQFQVPDDAFHTRNSPPQQAPLRGPSPFIIDVTPSPSPAPPEPTRSSRRGSLEDEERDAQRIYEEATHSTAPVSEVAMAAAIAAAELARRRHDHEEDGRGRGTERTADIVMEEANKAYHERRLVERANRSRSGSKGPSERSVVDNYKDDEDCTQPPRIVTPPEMKSRQKSRFSEPDADVRFDNMMSPTQLLGYWPREAPVRDPSAERPRPVLNLVLPTPVPTPLPEVQREKERKPVSESPKRDMPNVVIGPRGEVVQVVEVTETPTTPKRVSWGPSETTQYEVESPERSSRDEPAESPRPKSSSSGGWGALAAAIAGVGVGSALAKDEEPVREDRRSSGSRSPPKERPILPIGVSSHVLVEEPEELPPVPGPKPASPQMPGSFGDDLDFTATLAAGLEHSGFDPEIVIEDPTYRRRDSPPGSNEDFSGIYTQPFAETVTDLGVFDDGTRTVRDPGYVIGEVVETPASEKAAPFGGSEWPQPAAEEERSPEMPKLSKKEQRKLDKAAKLAAAEAEERSAGLVQTPDDEWAAASTSSKKSKKSKRSKRSSVTWEDETAPVSESQVSVSVDAFDDLQDDNDEEWDMPKKSGRSKRDSKRSSKGYDDPPDRDDRSSELFEPFGRDGGSTLSEPRHDDDRDDRSIKSDKRSSGSSFWSLLKGSSSNGDESFSKKDSAGTLGAGAGLAGAAVAAAAIARSHAAEAPSEQEEPHVVQNDTHSRADSPVEVYSDPEIVPRVIKPAIDPQYGDLLPLPPSPGEQTPQDFHDNDEFELPALPDSRPATPPEYQRTSLYRDRDSSQQRPSQSRRTSTFDLPPRSPSHTAIPIQFRMGHRSMPAASGTPDRRVVSGSSAYGSPTPTVLSPTAVQESSPTFKRQAAARPTSWDSSREIKPLYLLEQAGQSTKEGSEPAQGMPLPPSRESPAPEETTPLVVDTDAARSAAGLGSQESTPRVAAKQAFAEEQIPSPVREPEATPLDLPSASSMSESNYATPAGSPIRNHEDQPMPEATSRDGESMHPVATPLEAPQSVDEGKEILQDKGAEQKEKTSYFPSAMSLLPAATLAGVGALLSRGRHSDDEKSGEVAKENIREAETEEPIAAPSQLGEADRVTETEPVASSNIDQHDDLTVSAPEQHDTPNEALELLPSTTYSPPTEIEAKAESPKVSAPDDLAMPVSEHSVPEALELLPATTYSPIPEIEAATGYLEDEARGDELNASSPVQDAGKRDQAMSPKEDKSKEMEVAHDSPPLLSSAEVRTDSDASDHNAPVHDDPMFETFETKGKEREIVPSSPLLSPAGVQKESDPFNDEVPVHSELVSESPEQPATVDESSEVYQEPGKTLDAPVNPPNNTEMSHSAQEDLRDMSAAKSPDQVEDLDFVRDSPAQNEAVEQAGLGESTEPAQTEPPAEAESKQLDPAAEPAESVSETIQYATAEPLVEDEPGQAVTAGELASSILEAVQHPSTDQQETLDRENDTPATLVEPTGIPNDTSDSFRIATEDLPSESNAPMETSSQAGPLANDDWMTPTSSKKSKKNKKKRKGSKAVNENSFTSGTATPNENGQDEELGEASQQQPTTPSLENTEQLPLETMDNNLTSLTAPQATGMEDEAVDNTQTSRDEVFQPIESLEEPILPSQAGALPEPLSTQSGDSPDTIRSTSPVLPSETQLQQQEQSEDPAVAIEGNESTDINPVGGDGVSQATESLEQTVSPAETKPTAEAVELSPVPQEGIDKPSDTAEEKHFDEDEAIRQEAEAAKVQQEEAELSRLQLKRKPSKKDKQRLRDLKARAEQRAQEDRDSQAAAQSSSQAIDPEEERPKEETAEPSLSKNLAQEVATSVLEEPTSVSETVETTKSHDQPELPPSLQQTSQQVDDLNPTVYHPPQDGKEVTPTALEQQIQELEDPEDIARREQIQEEESELARLKLKRKPSKKNKDRIRLLEASARRRDEERAAMDSDNQTAQPVEDSVIEVASEPLSSEAGPSQAESEGHPQLESPFQLQPGVPSFSDTVNVDREPHFVDTPAYSEQQLSPGFAAPVSDIANPQSVEEILDSSNQPAREPSDLAAPYVEHEPSSTDDIDRDLVRPDPQVEADSVPAGSQTHTEELETSPQIGENNAMETQEQVLASNVAQETPASKSELQDVHEKVLDVGASDPDQTDGPLDEVRAPSPVSFLLASQHEDVSPTEHIFAAEPAEIDHSKQSPSLEATPVSPTGVEISGPGLTSEPPSEARAPSPEPLPSVTQGESVLPTDHDNKAEPTPPTGAALSSPTFEAAASSAPPSEAAELAEMLMTQSPSRQIDISVDKETAPVPTMGDVQEQDASVIATIDSICKDPILPTSDKGVDDTEYVPTDRDAQNAAAPEHDVVEDIASEDKSVREAFNTPEEVIESTAAQHYANDQTSSMESDQPAELSETMVDQESALPTQSTASELPPNVYSAEHSLGLTESTQDVSQHESEPSRDPLVEPESSMPSLVEPQEPKEKEFIWTSPKASKKNKKNKKKHANSSWTEPSSGTQTPTAEGPTESGSQDAPETTELSEEPSDFSQPSLQDARVAQPVETQAQDNDWSTPRKSTKSTSGWGLLASAIAGAGVGASLPKDDELDRTLISEEDKSVPQDLEGQAEAKDLETTGAGDVPPLDATSLERATADHLVSSPRDEEAILEADLSHRSLVEDLQHDMIDEDTEQVPSSKPNSEQLTKEEDDTVVAADESFDPAGQPEASLNTLAQEPLIHNVDTNESLAKPDIDREARDGEDTVIVAGGHVTNDSVSCVEEHPVDQPSPQVATQVPETEDIAISELIPKSDLEEQVRDGEDTLVVTGGDIPHDEPLFDTVHSVEQHPTMPRQNPMDIDNESPVESVVEKPVVDDQARDGEDTVIVAGGQIAEGVPETLSAEASRSDETITKSALQEKTKDEDSSHSVADDQLPDEPQLSGAQGHDTVTGDHVPGLTDVGERDVSSRSPVPWGEDNDVVSAEEKHSPSDVGRTSTRPESPVPWEDSDLTGTFVTPSEELPLPDEPSPAGYSPKLREIEEEPFATPAEQVALSVGEHEPLQKPEFRDTTGESFATPSEPMPLPAEEREPLPVAGSRDIEAEPELFATPNEPPVGAKEELQPFSVSDLPQEIIEHSQASIEEPLPPSPRQPEEEAFGIVPGKKSKKDKKKKKRGSNAQSFDLEPTASTPGRETPLPDDTADQPIAIPLDAPDSTANKEIEPSKDDFDDWLPRKVSKKEKRKAKKASRAISEPDALAPTEPEDSTKTDGDNAQESAETAQQDKELDVAVGSPQSHPKPPTLGSGETVTEEAHDLGLATGTNASVLSSVAHEPQLEDTDPGRFEDIDPVLTRSEDPGPTTTDDATMEDPPVLTRKMSKKEKRKAKKKSASSWEDDVIEPTEPQQSVVEEISSKAEQASPEPTREMETTLADASYTLPSTTYQPVEEDETIKRAATDVEAEDEWAIPLTRKKTIKRKGKGKQIASAAGSGTQTPVVDEPIPPVPVSSQWSPEREPAEDSDQAREDASAPAASSWSSPAVALDMHTGAPSVPTWSPPTRPSDDTEGTQIGAGLLGVHSTELQKLRSAGPSPDIWDNEEYFKPKAIDSGDELQDGPYGRVEVHPAFSRGVNTTSGSRNTEERPLVGLGLIHRHSSIFQEDAEHAPKLLTMASDNTSVDSVAVEDVPQVQEPPQSSGALPGANKIQVPGASDAAPDSAVRTLEGSYVDWSW